MQASNTLLASHSEVPGLPGIVIHLWFDFRGRYLVGTVTGDRGVDAFFRIKEGELECGTSHGWQNLAKMRNRMGADSEHEAICWALYMRAGRDFSSEYIWNSSKNDPFWKRLVDESKHLALTSGVMLT